MAQNIDKKENTQNTHYSDKKGEIEKTITESSERKINPNSLTNLTPFKKGVSGNPSGKPSNKEFKKAVSVSYLDRLYKYSQTKFGKMRMNKEALNEMQKKYLEQAKLLDISLPTTGLDSQLAINFSKGK